MMHKNRTWCIFPIATPEELADKLAESTWCLCTAFEIGEYLFLNDATSEDGAAEYAVLKKLASAEAPYVQLESITASWMTKERLFEFICRTLAGEIGLEVEWACEVRPRLESSERHKRCHLLRHGSPSQFAPSPDGALLSDLVFYHPNNAAKSSRRLPILLH